MELEKMFALFEDLKKVANVSAVFGEPETVGDKTIIPIAQVGYGFGMGFGEGKSPAKDEEGDTEEGKGGGGGGGASVRPLAVLEITPNDTKLTSVVDATKIALAGMALAAWLWFLIGRGRIAREKKT
jgi:uncharacterized spore protein YtfJ